MCESNRNHSLTRMSSVCRTPGPLCQFVLIKTCSLQLMSHSSVWRYTTRAHRHTQTQRGCHSTQHRWWACGRQIPKSRPKCPAVQGRCFIQRDTILVLSTPGEYLKVCVCSKTAYNYFSIIISVLSNRIFKLQYSNTKGICCNFGC